MAAKRTVQMRDNSLASDNFTLVYRSTSPNLTAKMRHFMRHFARGLRGLTELAGWLIVVYKPPNEMKS